MLEKVHMNVKPPCRVYYRSRRWIKIRSMMIIPFQLKHFHVSYLRFIMTNKHCTFGYFNLEALLKIIMVDIIDLNPPLHHVLHTKKEMSWSYKPWWHILATNCVEPINMTKRRKRSLSTEWIKLLESFPIKQRFRDSPCFLFENLIFWSFFVVYTA